MTGRRVNPAPQSADRIEGGRVRVGIIGGSVLVSPPDYRLAKVYRWRVNKDGYAGVWVYDAQAKRGRSLLLHRLVCRVADDVLVDHKNRDRLDATRENLRPATPSGNSANRAKIRKGTSSRYRGVTLHAATGKWQAGAKQFDTFHHCGLFESEEAAARAYDKKARELWGDFAACNFALDTPNASQRAA